MNRALSDRAARRHTGHGRRLGPRRGCDPLLRYKGEAQILVAWAGRMKMKPGTLGARLAEGWSVARALTQPVAPWRGRP